LGDFFLDTGWESFVEPFLLLLPFAMVLIESFVEPFLLLLPFAMVLICYRVFD
jgi:hypothetical protein